MFKKSKVKIVAMIMAVLMILLAGIIAIIYFVSYADINSQNQEMLKLYSDAYAANGVPDGKMKNGPGEDRRFQLSVFYSVSFSLDGEVLDINNDSGLLFSDEELITFAKQLLTKNKSYGITQDIAYLITKDDSSYTLVAMMDTMVIGESISTLLNYTLVFAGIAIIIFLVISIFLANWIIKPIEKTYQKQKQFISDAGHELKTPISTIHTNAELLSQTIGENKWLSNIQYENKRMSRLVIQLLDLAKLENISIVLEKIDLGRIVLAAALPFEGIAYEKGIKYTYTIEENLQIKGNRRQMSELVSILLDNAFQHSVKKGSITISLSSYHGLVTLSVSNQGEEIPLNQREEIFERFYRADQARNSESNRYGLGLAISKAIVLAHHGKISVSCKDGVTTFVVRIPKML